MLSSINEGSKIILKNQEIGSKKTTDKYIYKERMIWYLLKLLFINLYDVMKIELFISQFNKNILISMNLNENKIVIFILRLNLFENSE